MTQKLTELDKLTAEQAADLSNYIAEDEAKHELEKQIAINAEKKRKLEADRAARNANAKRNYRVGKKS